MSHFVNLHYTKMPPKRRGSKTAPHTSTWTELFHRMATGTLPSDIVIRQVPAIATKIVHYMQKSTTQDNQANINDSICDEKTNEVDKTNNVTDNKTEDHAVFITSNGDDKDNSQSEYSIPCTGTTKGLNETDQEILGESFVYLEHEDNVKSNMLEPINAVITGLPDHVTEDQVLKELALDYFCPIGAHKVTSEDLCQPTESFFLVQVPEYIGSRLLRMSKLLGYNINVKKEDPEHKIPECTKCKKFGHDKYTCELLTGEIENETSESKLSRSNSTTDLGYNSVNLNNSHALNESISKVDIFSSSTNSTTNSENLKEESNESVPKETYLRDTTKLMKELKEIKKEVEHIKFELKINVAKKVDSDFLHVILQGIPVEIENEVIVNELKSKHFSVKNIYRLTNEDNKVMKEVFIELPKEQDRIFYFSCCLGFEVRVEEYKGDFSSLKNSQFLCNTCVSPKKRLNVLFRDIPTDISESDILRDLQKKTFHPIAVHKKIPTKRYLLGKTKHVILVQVPAEEGHIYGLSCILGFPVTVEGVDKGTLNIAQCKTCQQFGHSTVKCSEKKFVNLENNSARKCKVIDDGPTLIAVVKGVPIEYCDETVANDFIKNGFSPIAVHRMVVNDEILPTYLVQVPEQEKRILRVTCCLGFSVKVEIFLPHLYHLEQCKKCRQIGKHSKNCVEKEEQEGFPDNDINSQTVEIVESKKSISDIIIDISDSEKIEVDLEEYFSKSTFLISNSTEMECLEQKLTNKMNNSEITSPELIKKNSEELHELRCCQVAKISTNDASTNTDNPYVQMEQMSKAIRSYENISVQFMKNVGLFAKSFAGKDDNSKNIGETFESYHGVREISAMTAPFVEAMIGMLQSITNLMLDIPNLPGITINSINEQLHLLEKLKNIKETMDGTPSCLTTEYDINFPKLE